MKKSYIKVLLGLLLLITSTQLSAMWGGWGGQGPRKTSPFLAGAEIKVRPINVMPKTSPTDRDTVEVRLIYYRDCEANAGTSYTVPTLTDTVIGMLYSIKKCEYLKFACWYNESMSHRDATPLCPFSTSETKCINANSPNVGYRTEVFADTVVLPVNTDDWLFAFQYSSSAQVNRMNFYTKKYDVLGERCTEAQTNPPPTGITPPYLGQVPRGMNPPSPFSCRMSGINTMGFNDATESYFYIEATYSNALDCGYFYLDVNGNPVPRYCANTTPHSASSPFIFQCVNRNRVYDLGYYDEDNHKMTFTPSSPFKYKCFGDPSCGQPDPQPVPISFNSGAGCSESNPLCNNGTFNMDPNTGVISFSTSGPVGKYKAAMKVEEFDKAGTKIGQVFREYVITILDGNEQCGGETNSITDNAFFLDNSLRSFVNCAKVAGTTNLIEACAGTNVSFRVLAESRSPIPSASLDVDGVLPAYISNTQGEITTGNRITHEWSQFDTSEGVFTWNIPANAPPGEYPIIFQIKACSPVGTYNLSRTVVYRLRINKVNKISWEYLNFIPKTSAPVFGLDKLSDRSFHCGSPIALVYKAFNLEENAIVNWRMYNTTTGNIDEASTPDDYFSPTANTPGTNYLIEMVSNQYCNNRDTIHLISKPAINPTLKLVLKDSCYGTSGTLEVEGLAGSTALTSLFDWQSLGSSYAETPSFLSNTSKILIDKKNNNYTCYVISADTCVYPLSKQIPLEGIKPRGEFYTDKEYVCPEDTINVSNPLLTTSICSPTTDFSTPFGPDKTVAYSGTQSNTNPSPKIFTATPAIDRGRTALLYRGSELKKQNFKAGVIKKIAFYIDGINDPTVYNLVDIYVKCTDRFDLQNGVFEDTTYMTKIHTASSKLLATGWNTFDIKPFVWDGETSLYFEVWTKCNKPCSGTVPTSPAYLDHLTNYVSIMGQYGNSTNSFEQAAVVTSNYRHNIQFTYQDIQENIQVSWNQKPFVVNNGTQSSLYNATLLGNPSDVKEPKIVSQYPVTYTITMTNGKCKDSLFLDALVDTNYKIIVTPDVATKCPGDTVQLNSQKGYLKPRPFNLVCGVEIPIPDSCRKVDSTFSPIFGTVGSTVGDPRHSPFGGVTAALGNNTTDKRIQILYPYNELRGNPNMRPGYIKELAFEIVNSFVNTNKMLNFAIRMKCVPASQDTFENDNFESLSTFEEVYFKDELSTVFGWNQFKLQKEFSWSGTTGLMIDICFDNFNDYPYRAEEVAATSQGTKKRCLYRAANVTGSAPAEFGCTYLTGTRDVIRPNIQFYICKPTRTPPAIPREVRWAPTSFISNTQITNPIIYNKFTTKYYTILDYVDTTYDKQKVVCRVRDTMNSIVDRPYVKFDPPVAVSCEGKSINVSAGVVGMNSNLYTYEWDTTQYGKVKADYNSPNQIITPPNPGYHYVTVYSINNPNCYNSDSIYVNIQKLKTMPDLGGPALLCVGDSVLLSIPDNLGYKNPKWRFNGQIIDTGYKIKVNQAGAYSMIVDSGACTNTSADKLVTMRPKDTASLLTSKVSICEGDSALIMYNKSDNVANPIWNTGKTTPYIKVNQAGIYFLVNPRDQYGCLMHMRDTATVSVISNPDFKLVDDTICLTNNQTITLQPVPFDPTATYTWYPEGRKLNSLTVYVPGEYKVVRDLNGCKKEAKAMIYYDTAGNIALGKNQAICCDEVLTLDANPDGKKYKGFVWSTGEKSQVIYTKPNVSGLYVVEAIKPNGCKDTGSIFIDSKCTQVKAKPEFEAIHIGQTNQIIGQQLNVNATNITYKWVPSEDFNKVEKGDKLNAIAVPKDTGDVEYVLVMTVTDTNYMPPKEPCVENEVVRFKVMKNQMDTVNVFSPDGDGINDYFYPRVKGVVDFKEIKIYNRYGQLLHDNPKVPWDGKFNNEYQPVGVYVCFISYDLHEARKDLQTKYDKIIVTLIR